MNYDIGHHKYAAIFAVTIIIVLVGAIITTNPTGYIVADTNVVSDETLPSPTLGCDPEKLLNKYEKLISNGDGTVTILSYNTCYPGCTGISMYTRTGDKLSQKTECERTS
jgi:hypothetical protein